MLKRFTLVIQVVLISVTFAAGQGRSKALTNADVIEMVKAGLPESTIVLSIERSPANYDTSTQALIQLNKAMVSAKVLDAMVKAQTPAKASEAPVTNQVSKGAFQEMSSASAASSGVRLIDESQRIAMKRMTPSTKTNSGKLLIPYAGIFMKAKSYLVFNGNHSDLRTGNKTPEFEVGIAADLKASDAIGVVQLEIDKETRKCKMLEIGAFGGKSGNSQKFIVPIDLHEVPGSTAGAMTTYRIKTIAPLKPGEYAVVVNGVLYYDFGIDAIR